MAARHRAKLIGFSAFTLASGWIGAAIDTFVPQPAEQDETLGMAFWLAGPLIGGAIYWISIREFRIGLRPRMLAAWKHWCLAALAFPTVSLASITAARATGGASLAGFGAGALATACATALPAAALKNVFEEFVWRGLLVTELVKQRLSDPFVYLASGGIWGLWHIPYYLHFLPRDQMRTVLDVDPAAFAALAAATMLGWGVLFAELYRASGSIWPAVLMHAVEDSFVNPLVLDGHVSFASTASAIAFSPVIGIVPTCAYVGIGLALRARRRRRESVVTE